MVKFGVVKTKNCSPEDIWRMTREGPDWKKIFVKHISIKDLYSGHIKKLAKDKQTIYQRI